MYRLAQARLPWPWTLDTFPFAEQPGVDRSQIRALAGLDFVRRAQNLVLIGPTGTGKTGIAVGLLRQACLNGYTGRFYNAQDLFDELYAWFADRTTTKLLKAMSRMRPIVIDELGYLTLKPEQVNAFFRLMEQRYARVSTVITANLHYPSWYELFGNKPMVDALLDRLRHQWFASPHRRAVAARTDAVPRSHHVAGDRRCNARRRPARQEALSQAGLTATASIDAGRAGAVREAPAHTPSAPNHHRSGEPIDGPLAHKCLRTCWVSFW